MDFSKIAQDVRLQNYQKTLMNKKMLQKWDETGLLEGLKGRNKVNMARLLESQALGLVNEGLLREASDTADIKGFSAIAFPLVRRVFGNLLAQEICSVQPMALPAGLIFWLDFTHGTAKAGTGKNDWTAGGSVFGDPLVPLTGGASATGGHYNLHNSYTQFEATGTLDVASSGAATWAEVDYDPDLSASAAASQLFKLTVDLDEDASITNIDETNYKSFAVKGHTDTTGTGHVGIFRRHNLYNSTTKVLTVFYSASAVGGAGGMNSGSALTCSYVKKSSHGGDTTGTTLNPAFEYAFDNSDHIPELDIKLASHPVVAQDRKLKVKWTPELAQDLNAYHTLDAEAELTQVIADQVALDIDGEILQDMVNNARAATYYWDRQPGVFRNKKTGALISGPSFTGNVQEWYLTLLEVINDVSNVIHTKTLKTGANFLVTSPDVCTILESIVQFRPVMDFTDPTQVRFSMGVEKVGSLASRYTVYKAPFFLKNKILVGYKGDDWLTTGYVYAPYVPMIVTPTIYEPDNFTPRKAVMTRYGKQIVRGDFYGLVVVLGMDVF